MAKRSFMKGAVILGAAGIVVKILGAFFRIPLANIIGDTGMGYYQTAYPIYVLLLALSTAGIPTAIARMVSERTAAGNHREAYRVFKLSFVLLLGIGITTCLILLLGAPLFVKFSTYKAIYAIRAISPALLVIPIMAAFRGYTQGLQDMTPTAVSQIVEQFFRVLTGLAMAVILVPKGLEFAAAGASFGATAGGICGLIAILIIFFRQRKDIKRKTLDTPPDAPFEKSGTIIKNIILIAIPITIGAAIMPVMSNIDLAIVSNRLVETGFSRAEANSLYGQLSGFATPLINFPQVLTQSIALSLVPAIAAAHQTGDSVELRRNTELGMRTAMIVGLPCAAGLFVLAKPIMLLLYPTQKESAVSAAGCLAVLAVGVIFLSSVQTLTGILQGVGKQMVPVVNLCIGAVFKIVVTYVLTGIPAINVKGAAAGTVCAYLVASALNLRAAAKYTGSRFSVSLTFLRPGAASLLMGTAVWLVYTGLHNFMGNALSTMMSVIVGIAVYAFLVFALHCITEEELLMLPKGARLARLARKLKLY
ncbi:MAG: polysaccharide biosynthesis protein [Anaerovoracaceae bacterium]|nr:polysaccharide biosynthesis protein [Bacillota bacterium]MDY2670570.1 polysaccharide biosynthesis protein [Anaerovoracaceae bacterium]